VSWCDWDTGIGPIGVFTGVYTRYHRKPHEEHSEKLHSNLADPVRIIPVVYILSTCRKNIYSDYYLLLRPYEPSRK